MNRSEIENMEMKSLVSCTKSLEKMGFITQFKVTATGLLKSMVTGSLFSPPEVRLLNCYIFKEESSQMQNSAIYAIETVDGERGTIVDGSCHYGDAYVINFIRQVENIERELIREHLR
jgi:hypothetical protein